MTSWIRLGLALAVLSTHTRAVLAESFPLPGAGDDLIGHIRHTRAHQEDTLIDIARRFSIGQDEMVMANPTVDRWLPKQGTEVTIPQFFILPDAPRSGIVVNIPEMRLYYFPVRASAARKASAPAAVKPRTVTTCKPVAEKPSGGARAAPQAASASHGKTQDRPASAAHPKTPARPPAKPAQNCVTTTVPAPRPAPVADTSSFESAGTGEVISYPVSMGRMDWRTPIGRTTVVNKQKDPSWTPPASIKREHAAKGDPLPDVVPPGPDNPLGKFAMRLGVSGYLIHGTDVAKADGIGMRVTHGCMRLYNEDIARLFPLVPVGSPVYLVNQPIKLGWKGSLLYMEASQPLDEDVGIPNHDPDEDVGKETLRREDEQRSRFLMRIARTEIQKMQDKTGASVDMEKVRRYLDRPTGMPVVIGGSGSGWRSAAEGNEGMSPAAAAREDDPNLRVTDAPSRRPLTPPGARAETDEAIDRIPAPPRPAPVSATRRVHEEDAPSEPGTSSTVDELYSTGHSYRSESSAPGEVIDRPADARTSPYPVDGDDPVDQATAGEAAEEN